MKPAPTTKTIRVDSDVSIEHCRLQLNQLSTEIDGISTKIRDIFGVLDFRDSETQEYAQELLKRLSFLQSTRDYVTNCSIVRD
jgi:hypothetical protein